MRRSQPTPDMCGGGAAGCQSVYLVTNFWEHLAPQREIDQAVAAADAAVAAGVTHLVWSGLEDTRPLLAGVEGVETVSEDYKVRACVCACVWLPSSGSAERAARAQHSAGVGGGSVHARVHCKPLRSRALRHALMPPPPTQPPPMHACMQVPHFDAKAAATAAMRAKGVPVTTLITSAYCDNYLSYFRPHKQEDGSYVIALPDMGDKKCAVVSVRDIGKAAAALLAKVS